ncbi:MAG: right-handed parallel beta-helix repeat-containing protein [Candidatus Micrarchaeia archaeon]
MNAKAIFMFLLFAGNVFSAIPVTNCATLNSDNEVYVLQNSVQGADCIKITGENITFNLNGYNVNGYGGYGIVIRDASGILVENGTSNSVHGGIYVENSQNSIIRNLATSTLSGITIDVINSRNISFIEVNYTRNCGYAGTALIFSNTTDSVIEDSMCTRACGSNLEYDWISSCVNLFGSNNNIVQNNYMYDAYRNGIYIYQSNNNTISENRIEHSHWYGIAVREGENNTITGNTFIDSGLVHIYFEANGKNNNYSENENKDGDRILVFIDQENILFENNQTSEIVLFNVTNATFRNITMVKGGINILGNGTANITFDEFEIKNAGAAIFMIPEYESIDVLNGKIIDSTYGFYGTVDSDVYVENLNGTNIARYPIGLDVSSAACGELSVSNYTVDGNEVVYTTVGGSSTLSGTYSQIFMCGVSTANILDSEITHALFSYYSDGVDARRITLSGAYIPVKLLGSDGVYLEDFIINNARIEGMNVQDSNNTEIVAANVTTVSDSSIPTFNLVDLTYSEVGVYTKNVDGFILNKSRVENADASVWMLGYSRNVDIYGSIFRTGLDGVRIENIKYGTIESNVFSDFSQRGMAVRYANKTEVKYNNITNSGGDINNGAINFYGGKDISVYRNRINARSGIIFLTPDDIIGIYDYLTEFYIYENEIENIPGTAGVYVVARMYGSTTKFEITDNNISDSLNGVRLLNAKNGTVCRNRIEDSTYGVYVIDSGELYFCDSRMQNVTNFPVFTDYSNAGFCGSTNISNVTHEDEVLEYYNAVGLVIENIDDRSQIILCNVNDSTIRNIEMDGSEGELGILAVLSNRNRFYEISGNKVYSMTYLLRSNENTISNYTVDNAQIGVMADLSSANRIENSVLGGTAGEGVKIYRDSHNNTVYNMNITGQPIIIDNAAYYLPQSNVVYANRINGSGIMVYGSKYTAVHDNLIHNGKIQMQETSDMNTSYNNFTGTCSGWECIYCRGYNNIVYKNLLTLDVEPRWGVLVVGTTNNVSRNYFANTIVRLDSGNTGCGNLYSILNISGPTDVTNRSCFPGNITEVKIYPTPVYESSNASCRIYYAHEDPYDAENVQFRWYVNGVYVPAYDGYGSGARNSWIESNVSLPENESSAGDNITCEARAYDGTYWSEWRNETVEVVADTCGIDINETSVDFGSLTTNVVSAEKSVRVTNPGTAAGNFSINGTNWIGPVVFSSTRTRWATSSGSYETKTPLNATPVPVYVNLPGGDFFNLYLQLYTPMGQQNGTYTQTITMIAECP